MYCVRVCVCALILLDVILLFVKCERGALVVMVAMVLVVLLLLLLLLCP